MRPDDKPIIFDWVEIFSEVALELGIAHRITSVIRTRSEQAALYEARGSSALPAARPGASTHEYGLAFDVVAEDPADQGTLGQLGEALGMYWGGRFRRKDPVHFQVVKPSLWASLFAGRVE